MRLRSLVAVSTLVLAAGCGASGGRQEKSAPASTGARVGIDPVPAVHLFENHSSSLIAWRRAGVRDRILVHVDGHSDLDWLPDAAIARLAAADPDELGGLELHPYTLDGTTHVRFGIWNFVYPAARLGVVREYVWVVPDGTLATPQAAGDLVRRMILGKMQMVSLDEANTLHLDGKRIVGTVLGLKVTICELADLPAFDEPVLLDIDLDFLTTRSGATQEVADQPWITPEALVARLRDKGLRADIATLSLSTMGGYLPPGCRWVGPAAIAALKRPAASDGDVWKARAAAEEAAASRPETAANVWKDLVARHPADGSAWYRLARAEERGGRAAEAADARAKAIAADPVLQDAELFEADALWMNQSYAEALESYRAHRRRNPRGPFLAYGLRREAGCLMRVGRDDEAVETFRKVIALAPGHGDTHLDLGLLLRDRGDVAGAIAEFREARRILPDQAAYAMALGTTYARQGQLDAALAEIEAAVSRRPTWAQARVNLGLLMLQAGRPVDAAGQFKAAARLEPGDPQITLVLEQLRKQGIATTEVSSHP